MSQITKYYNGRELALKALSGQTTERILVGLFTWEFSYLWKIAEIPAWQLACGGSETWHSAHIKLLERHNPDLLWYSGAGAGPEEPTLLSENDESWFVCDNNNKLEYELRKNSYALSEKASGKKSCDAVGDISSKSDADRLVPEFAGWGVNYLDGLSRLVSEVGERALVLPHHSPAYVCACYAFGFEQAMEKMLCEPELFFYVCDRFAAGDSLRMKELAAAGAEAVFLADAWASCDIISPDMVRKFALPYQKSIIQMAHDAGLKVILWNEGNILPVLEDEAKLDMDAFAFEQSRKGVELTVEKVRKAFGPDRCLFGNVDSELMLLRNDPKEIAMNVKIQIEQSGENSPFILSTGSPVSDDISPEAIDTMFDAAKQQAKEL